MGTSNFGLHMVGTIDEVLAGCEELVDRLTRRSASEATFELPPPRHVPADSLGYSAEFVAAGRGYWLIISAI
ncbi:hypothetical protein THAOC_36787, partial [Thalassiosira oceanica]